MNRLEAKESREKTEEEYEALAEELRERIEVEVLELLKKVEKEPFNSPKFRSDIVKLF